MSKDIKLKPQFMLDLDGTGVEMVSIPLSEYKKLVHYRDTTVGLFATDEPRWVKDPKKILFELIY